MNETLALIHSRRSVRAYSDRPVDRDTADVIIRAAMRAPTAGNLMLYSIIEIADPSLKHKLSITCDNQPFIAKAPLVLMFVADYQRWFDTFLASDVQAICAAGDQEMRLPGEGDLLLACCDALIAAQTAVLAAESLGMGSCYIGDIMENYEVHRELLDLPQYVFPVSMVCFGYPTPAAAKRRQTPRYPQETVHFTDSYQRLDDEQLRLLNDDRRPRQFVDGATNVGQNVYLRKFSADYSMEMTRSVREAIRAWAECR